MLLHDSLLTSPHTAAAQQQRQHASDTTLLFTTTLSLPSPPLYQYLYLCTCYIIMEVLMTLGTRLHASPPGRRLLQATALLSSPAAASRLSLRGGPLPSLFLSSARSFSSSSSAGSSNSDEMEDDDSASPSSSSSSGGALPALPRQNLKPSELVAELDRHIVGQQDAKRAVAVALRNRYRRHLLPAAMKADVTPRNILMLGPTGCGQYRTLPAGPVRARVARSPLLLQCRLLCCAVLCGPQARRRSLVGWLG